jgi:hypothetical protein
LPVVEVTSVSAGLSVASRYVLYSHAKIRSGYWQSCLTSTNLHTTPNHQIIVLMACVLIDQGTHFSREHLVQLLAKQTEYWDMDNDRSSRSRTLDALALEPGKAPAAARLAPRSEVIL